MQVLDNCNGAKIYFENETMYRPTCSLKYAGS